MCWSILISVAHILSSCLWVKGQLPFSVHQCWFYCHLVQQHLEFGGNFLIAKHSCQLSQSILRLLFAISVPHPPSRSRVVPKYFKVATSGKSVEPSPSYSFISLFWRFPAGSRCSVFDLLTFWPASSKHPLQFSSLISILSLVSSQRTRSSETALPMACPPESPQWWNPPSWWKCGILITTPYCTTLLLLVIVVANHMQQNVLCVVIHISCIWIIQFCVYSYFLGAPISYVVETENLDTGEVQTIQYSTAPIYLQMSEVSIYLFALFPFDYGLQFGWMLIFRCDIKLTCSWKVYVETFQILIYFFKENIDNLLIIYYSGKSAGCWVLWEATPCSVLIVCI